MVDSKKELVKELVKGILKFSFINYSFCLFHAAGKFPYLYTHYVHCYSYEILESFSKGFFGFLFFYGILCVFNL